MAQSPQIQPTSRVRAAYTCIKSRRGRSVEHRSAERTAIWPGASTCGARARTKSLCELTRASGPATSRRRSSGVGPRTSPARPASYGSWRCPGSDASRLSGSRARNMAAIATRAHRNFTVNQGESERGKIGSYDLRRVLLTIILLFPAQREQGPGSVRARQALSFHRSGDINSGKTIIHILLLPNL